MIENYTFNGFGMYFYYLMITVWPQTYFTSNGNPITKSKTYLFFLLPFFVDNLNKKKLSFLNLGDTSIKDDFPVLQNSFSHNVRY